MVARQERVAAGIILAHHERPRVAAQSAKQPLGVIRRRYAPRPRPKVVHSQPRHLHRVAGRHEHDELLLKPVAASSPLRVACSVSKLACGVGPRRLRRRRPDLRGLLVPQVERFARRVGDRIVRPGGETVLPAVDRPGKSSARFVDDTAEIGVRENVAPGSRRVLPRPEVDCIFPAVLRKATEAIVETQVHLPGKRRLHLVRHACPGGLKTRRRRVRLSGSRKLLRESTSRLVEDDTRNGFEQTHLVLAHLVREEQVHAAAAAQKLVCAQFVKQREDALAHRLHVDLVVLRTGVSGYVEPVRERVLSLLHELGAHELLGRSGGVHLLFADQMSKDEMCLLESVARVVLDESRGTLAQQLATAAEPHPTPPRFEPSGAGMPDQMEPALPRQVNLRFDNGLGGFTEDGREYAIYLGPGEHTPAPWCNVLANDDFGCIVNEAGGGFTWAVNSGENRLTPWTNDPVADPPSEALYLRDEETAEIWTPTPQPAGADAACEIRHGAGYTKWRRRSHGFEQELIVFVPPGDPVKVARLRVHNLRPRARRVTATYYAEWLLGALRSASRPFVVCEYDPGCHALLARNHWNPDFSKRVAFLTSSHPPHSVTADRQDFLGREGDPRNPAGLRRWDLGGRIEPGADPCAAFQVHLDIGAEQTTEVVFVLGQGRDRAHAEELARHWQEPGQVDRAFEELNQHWDRLLGAVRVRTPDPAFDLMLNRWLLYQTLSSRLLAL